jgi:hypothetical protein
LLAPDRARLVDARRAVDARFELELERDAERDPEPEPELGPEPLVLRFALEDRADDERLAPVPPEEPDPLRVAAMCSHLPGFE